MTNPMTTPPADQPAWLRALHGALRGMVSALTAFVLVTATLLLVNHARLLRAEPTDSPAMKALLEQLAEHPDDEALRQQVRALDLLARQAFFGAHDVARVGTMLLAVGVGLLLVVMQGMRLLRPDMPALPGCPGEGESAWAVAATARRLVLGLAAIWVGLALASGWWASRGYDPESVAQRLAQIAPGTDEDWTCAINETLLDEDGPLPDPDAWRCHWPAFRGPDGNGIAPAGASAPTDWDGPSGRNILWKVPVPRQGFSSPVVWGDRVFVTGGDRELREAYAFDVASGNLLWRCPTDGRGEPPAVTDDTGYAAPTPVTDGRHLLAIFATGELICVDLASGRRRWQANLARPDNPYGFASSLRLHDGLLFVQYDNVQGGELLAFDVRTGQRRWRVAREVQTSWSTPVLMPVDDTIQLVLHAPPRTLAYEPATGRELWSTPSYAGEMALCPGWADTTLVIHDDYGDIQAFDILRQATRWTTREEIPDVSSPLATGDLVILAASHGPVVCLDQQDGKLLWRKEYDAGFWGSATLVGDRIYLVDMNGVTRIFAAEREFRDIASPALGERSVCSPAIADGRLYLRGFTHLFAIGEPAAAAAAGDAKPPCPCLLKMAREGAGNAREDDNPRGEL
jgi:outer membrane protein assembly factor BamB